VICVRLVTSGAFWVVVFFRDWGDCRRGALCTWAQLWVFYCWFGRGLLLAMIEMYIL
jgi:hypothetical protein